MDIRLLSSIPERLKSPHNSPAQAHKVKKEPCVLDAVSIVKKKSLSRVGMNRISDSVLRRGGYESGRVSKEVSLLRARRLADSRRVSEADRMRIDSRRVRFSKEEIMDCVRASQAEYNEARRKRIGDSSKVDVFGRRISDVNSGSSQSSEHRVTVDSVKASYNRAWRAHIKDSRESLFNRIKDDEAELDKSSEVASGAELKKGSGVIESETVSKVQGNESVLNDIDTPEAKSALQEFSEALQSYIEGDSSALDALAEQEFSELAEQEIVEQLEGEESETVSEVKSEVKVPQTTADSIIAFVKGFKRGKNINKVIDALSPFVRLLKRYNFKVTDCCLPQYQEFDKVNTFSLPLTQAEFASANIPEITPVMRDLISQSMLMGEYGQCPPVLSCTVQNGICTVNGNQLYVPLVAEQEFSERLANAQNNSQIREIVCAYSAPLECVMHYAAHTDNLPYIDNSFYKKSTNAKGWSFSKENVPECLGGAEGNYIERCNESDSNIMLFGVPFVISMQ